jgi:uncharacterized protein YbaP (TraB family)
MITEALKAQWITLKEGMYWDGSRIQDHISSEALSKLEAFTEEIGIPFEKFERIKPWMLEIHIAVSDFMKAGYEFNKGIDLYFLKRARRDRKTIKELESVEFQLAMMSSLPEKVQEICLLETIEDYARDSDSLEELVGAWKRGDIQAMNNGLFESFDMNDPVDKIYYEKVFKDRNIQMADRIEEYLKSGIVHFVVVGSGHLLGEDSILTLLERKQYRIEQVESW